MRMDRRLIVFTVAMMIVLSTVLVYMIPRPAPSVETQRQVFPITFHQPIALGSDSDFTKPNAGSGCECVRSGSGKELDPYVISDWLINSTEEDGIIISGTKAHFVIARVIMKGHGLNAGVEIEESENGKVEDSQITGWWFGLYIFSSNNIELTNNTVTGNHNGIQIEASDNNKLVGNRFDSNQELGIFLRGSNNLLQNNSATGNSFGGINVDGTTGSARSNQLRGNIASENGVYGIGVWRGQGNTLVSNTVKHNKVEGIMLTDHSANNLIETNTVSDNGSGITLIDGSSGNTVSGNTARGNGDGVNYFDLYDTSGGNTWVDNSYDTKSPESLR
jgi:parallel beta-helix repeat protein